MSIKIGDVTYRNLQEQVAKNADDIASINADIEEKYDAVDTRLDDVELGLSATSSVVNAHTTQIAGKQDKLTAGTGIDITDNVISSTASGGTRLYKHSVDIYPSDDWSYEFIAWIVSARPTPYTDFMQIYQDFKLSTATGYYPTFGIVTLGGSILPYSRVLWINNLLAGRYEIGGILYSQDDGNANAKALSQATIDTESNPPSYFDTVTEL